MSFVGFRCVWDMDFFNFLKLLLYLIEIEYFFDFGIKVILFILLWLCKWYFVLFGFLYIYIKKKFFDYNSCSKKKKILLGKIVKIFFKEKNLWIMIIIV